MSLLRNSNRSKPHPGPRTRRRWTLGILLLLLISAWVTTDHWTAAIGRGLVCGPSHAPSDAIVIDNLEPDYPSFVRARELRQAGLASRVLVPVPTGQYPTEMDAIAREHALLLARVAGLEPIQLVGYRATEPISLHAARAIGEFARTERLRSILVVAPLFRSRRTELIYEKTIGRWGIATRCEPVAVTRHPTTWTRTWHGIEAVVEQWMKFLYYRMVLLE